MKIQNRSIYFCLLCLLQCCGNGSGHPTGTYVSTCYVPDGKPYSNFTIIDVEEDSIYVRQLNDFYRNGSTSSMAYPITILTKPTIEKFDGPFADTVTATITEEQITINSTNWGNNVTTARRVANVNDYTVRFADDRMVANKIFERGSDRSRWTFSGDNRIQIRDFAGKKLYEFDNNQLYSVDSFAGDQILNLHPNHNPKYFIREIAKSYLALEKIGCAAEFDTLRFVKDTIIKSVLPPQGVLAEQPKYAPKTYSTYWYETQWNLTFMNNGTFKFLPAGHASLYHLYTGSYEEQNGVIELNYVDSKFADFRVASDPTRLFRLDESHLRWPNGALLTLEGADDTEWEDIFHELVAVSAQMEAENKFNSRGESFSYIRAKIISIKPEARIKFSPVLRRGSTLDPGLADTLLLEEMRVRYPYVDPWAEM